MFLHDIVKYSTKHGDKFSIAVSTKSCDIVYNYYHFFLCVSKCDRFWFSFQDTGAEMLNENSEQILGFAPTSRAYVAATVCIWNKQSVVHLDFHRSVYCLDGDAR